MTAPGTPPRSALRRRLADLRNRRSVTLAMEAIDHDPHLARDIGLTPRRTRPALPSRGVLW